MRWARDIYPSSDTYSESETTWEKGIEKAKRNFRDLAEAYSLGKVIDRGGSKVSRLAMSKVAISVYRLNKGCERILTKEFIEIIPYPILNSNVRTEIEKLYNSRINTSSTTMAIKKPLTPQSISSIVDVDDDSQQFDIVNCYKGFLEANPDIPMPIAAIESLIEFIKHSKATTLSEFMKSLEEGSESLKSSTRNSISLSAGTDLFLRFVTRTSHDVTNLDACKEHLMESGKVLVEKAIAVRHKVAELGVQFIKDDARAAACKKRFKVYVTESRPSSLGLRSVKTLRKSGIPATVILDTAVGYVIGKVDAVFVGAEGVVENGGLINAIGTYQLAIVAKAANKPFYAVLESYKFLRLFPLNQYDLPTHTPDLLSFPDLDNRFSHISGHMRISDKYEHNHKQVDSKDETDEVEDYESNNPTVDYTPPEYITLLCTDLGVLTPSGVSDELIKLHLY
ncbi:11194_t:CDS:2 [Paraglomus brasilianum]|uniref:Translation initiation factor eIF2B subunit alpha n=1 Tax=Paraglomus brasilianum TaxID=144538 RepID=A0A9N9A256_9GLOM|nr:11194_t:CDS:2 [Paraglomus brasilianum]